MRVIIATVVVFCGILYGMGAFGPAPDEPAPAIEAKPMGGDHLPATTPRIEPQPPAQIEWFTNDYDSALRAAKAARKPVLIDFAPDWCGPCQVVKVALFERPEVIEFLSDTFICLRLGEGVKTRDEDTDARRQYDDIGTALGVRAVPAVSIVFNNRDYVKPFDPKREPAAFIEQLRGLLR